MSTRLNLESTIIMKFIDPAFEPQQFKADAEYLGIPDFENGFVECEFKRFARQFFEQFIAPPIIEYIKSEEAQQLEGRVSLDISATFKPIVEERLKKICKIIPGSWGSYGPPDYALWNWIADRWPFNKWVTKV